MSVAENLSAIRARISSIGVSPDSVTILGAAKRQPLATVIEALAAGVHCLGDNQVQEGRALRDGLEGAGAPGLEQVEWHFIGNIQSRKAKALVSYDCVQSLDRIKVAALLDRALAEANRTMPVLVEVNVGGESSKSGVAPGSAAEFLRELASYPRLQVRGLMGMPPPLEPVEKRRPFFRKLREMRDAFGLPVLSMGTSEDYWIAVEEGSTLIRLGTCLFGARAL